MSDIDYDKLGEEIAKHLHDKCPLGLSNEDAVLWHDFLRTIRDLKRKVWGGLTGVVILLFASLLLMGLMSWLREIGSK